MAGATGLGRGAADVDLSPGGGHIGQAGWGVAKAPTGQLNLGE